MAMKVSNILNCNTYTPKFTQIGIFCLKIYHLATLVFGSVDRFHLYESVDAVSLTHSPTENVRTRIYNDFLTLVFNSLRRAENQVRETIEVL
jgi:hypothetical protein